MYLNDIIAYKREEVRGMTSPSGKRSRPLVDPVSSLKERPFIAEIKRSSPSRGDIRPDVDHRAQARLYESGGAGAISVLTDTKFFKGSFGMLSDVAAEVALPLLCKDFIIGEVQIEHAFVSGADFVLLIAAVLSGEELERLSAKAAELGMKVLYEIHGPDEFRKIKGLRPELVGVNSRDLKTFTIDPETAMRTIRSLEGSFIRVAESGIESAADVARYAESGAGAFLVGTALMTDADPSGKIRAFTEALGGRGHVR